MGVVLARLEDLEWEEGRPANVEHSDPTQVSRRAWLARGECGTFTQYVHMPPHNLVRPHSHDHDELMVVMKGGCRFDGLSALGPGDAALVTADTPYSFEVGPDGMDFLIVRTAEATIRPRD
jgi:hypothetical protein